MTFQAQESHLEKLAQKYNLLTRIVQQRHTQKDAKASASNMDPSCPIQYDYDISNGTVDIIGGLHSEAEADNWF